MRQSPGVKHHHAAARVWIEYTNATECVSSREQKTEEIVMGHATVPWNTISPATRCRSAHKPRYCLCHDKNGNVRSGSRNCSIPADISSGTSCSAGCLFTANEPSKAFGLAQRLSMHGRPQQGAC